MDANYDLQSAGKALETSASDPLNNDDRRLSPFEKALDGNHGLEVVAMTEPKTWRIVKSRTDNGIAEEMVFSLQGILCAKELPPVTERRDMQPRSYHYLRQSITLTGFGTATFEDAIKASYKIYSLFTRRFPEGQLEAWKCHLLSGHSQFTTWNRYLTPVKDAPNMAHAPFTEATDPLGILKEMVAKGNHVHGEDNAVSYWIQRTNDDETSWFDEAEPQAFRIGDIVEAQFSFIVVPLRGHKFRMQPVLRSIALLDGTFSEAASKKRTSSTTPAPPITLKRKVGYGDAAGMAKKNRMNVDG